MIETGGWETAKKYNLSRRFDRASKNMIMNFRHKSNGEFAPKNYKRTKNSGFIWVWILLITFGSLMTYGAFLQKTETYIAPVTKLLTIDKSSEMYKAKIESLKDTLVNDLATKCETKGYDEPDGVIIFDSNNEASIGSFQFQRKTVKFYEKMFSGKDITNSEAIAIAIDHEKAFELAKKIIFEDKGKGVMNWTNCAKRLGLQEMVELIKSME